MKNIIKDLPTLISMWANDSIIDGNNLAEESIKSANKLSKYMEILVHNKFLAAQLRQKYIEMKQWKIQYYKGELNNPEDMATYNIKEPFRKSLLNVEIPSYIEADKDLNDLLMRKMIHDEIIEYCNLIIKELQGRSYAIGNAIKWKIFTGGG